MTRELQAWQWQCGELVADETHVLVSNLYSSNQIVKLLGSVDFTDVRVLGDYHGGAPTSSMGSTSSSQPSQRECELPGTIAPERPAADAPVTWTAI